MASRLLSSTETPSPDLLNITLHNDTDATDSHAADTTHTYTALFFAFAAIMLGVIGKEVTPKIPIVNKVPFTAIVFLVWVSLQAVNESHGLGNLGLSMGMWINIDPHLLLFAFLPALLFGDAKSTDTHLLARKIKEILTLASVGVLVGTFLTAVVAKYYLPYEWGWNLSLVLGSILAATDPVAVVGLLNSLGAPPAITMIIAGESMFNDGTAIVVFNLFLSLYSVEFEIEGALTDYAFTNATDILFYAFKAVVGGTMFGLAGGFIVISLLEFFDNKLHEDNALLQLTTTLSMAYIVFYVSEGLYGTSGVIATVTLGMFFSEFSRGLIVNYEVLEAGWECFEFMGNTLVFSLAGIIVGHILMDERMAEFTDKWDLFYIVGMWIASFITRMLMLFMMLPLIKYYRKNEWKDPNAPPILHELLVCGWGGLRGAVGLALAMLVRNQAVGTDQEKDCTKLLVHVTGVATLTLLVNATTCTPLLNYLGMTTVAVSHMVAVDCIHGKVVAETKEFTHHLMDKHAAHGMGSAIDRALKMRELKEICTIVGEAQKSTSEIHENTRKFTAVNAMAEKRELMLKLVRAEYNEMIDHTSVILPPERHNASRTLLNSTLIGMDDLSNLGDWEFIKQKIEVNKYKLAWMKFLDLLTSLYRYDSSPRRLKYLYKRRQDAYAMLLAFEKAHTGAQKLMIEIFGPDDEETKKVVEASKESIRKARHMRKNMDRRLVARVSMEHLAARILMYERTKVMKLVEHGVLSRKDEHHLLLENEHDFRRLIKKDHKLATDLAKEATFKERLPDHEQSRADLEGKLVTSPNIERMDRKKPGKKVHPETRRQSTSDAGFDNIEKGSEGGGEEAGESSDSEQEEKAQFDAAMDETFDSDIAREKRIAMHEHAQENWEEVKNRKESILEMGYDQELDEGYNDHETKGMDLRGSNTGGSGLGMGLALDERYNEGEMKGKDLSGSFKKKR